MQSSSEVLVNLMAEAHQLKAKMEELAALAPHLAPSIEPVIFGILEGTVQKPTK